MPSVLELSALMRLFSSTVFRELASKGRSPLFARLVEQANILHGIRDEVLVGRAFDEALSILKVSGRRNEYVYRSALTTKVLLGRHSLRTTSMLNEFRLGGSKADLIILNGSATVYEIKSERDSLYRIKSQIENYMRVFPDIYIVASEDHVEDLIEILPSTVGVICLSDRYSLSVERKSVSCTDQICPATAFDSLRAKEASAILCALGVDVPRVPNVQRYGVMREIFSKLEPRSMHREMVRTLKSTRSLATLGELVDHLPQSLHAAALSIPLRRSDHDRLLDAVNTPLSAAMCWGR